MTKFLEHMADSVRRLYAKTDLRVEPALREHGKVSFCKAGCWYCCRQLVVCSFPEGGAIAQELISRTDFYEWLPRLAEQAVATQEIMPADYVAKKKPCALLVGGRCSVYTVRPGVCRDFFTFGPDACTDENADTHATSRITNAAPELALYANDINSVLGREVIPPFASVPTMVLEALKRGTTGKRNDRVLAACAGRVEAPDVWFDWYVKHNPEALKVINVDGQHVDLDDFNK